MAEEVIAVDLGGTFLRVSKTINSKIINHGRKNTPKTKKEILDLLVNEIRNKISKRTRGIGIACAGVIDSGIIKKSPNLPLEGFDLKKFIQEKFRKKTIIENDANCVAIAELNLGVRKKNFIVLTFGTGIGGGIIIDGKLYKGQGFAGELGHIILDDEKDFEYLAASKKLKSLSRKYFGKDLWIKDLINSKNKRSKIILEEIVRYLGQGIASLISVFDPEVVVLAGGACECGENFLNLIRKQTYKHGFLPRKTPIQATKLKHAGTLGAGLLL